MAVQKPLQIDGSGNIAEVAAVESSAGAGDEGKIVALNASGQIDPTMLPGSGAFTATASEAIAAGAIINLWNSTGALKVRNADNSAVGKRAHGFASAAIASGASGTVNVGDGVINGLSSLTIGTQYFLGAAGAPTATVPTGTGTIIQGVGVATSATAIEFTVGDVVVRA